jgi:hypothetical protein
MRETGTSVQQQMQQFEHQTSQVLSESACRTTLDNNQMRGHICIGVLAPADGKYCELNVDVPSCLYSRFATLLCGQGVEREHGMIRAGRELTEH